ncbi:MAG: hypothetical protein R6U46_02655 [Marinilabilia sp.]
MKKLTYRFNRLVPLVTMIIIAGTVSCTKDFNEGPEEKTGDLKDATLTENMEVCGESTFNFWAGQNINAGEIKVSNDEENLYVTYHAEDEWELTEAHLFVGHIDELPRTKKGNPIPGQFPYSVEDLPEGTTQYTFVIELADLPDEECLAIVPHGVVDNSKKTETAWLLEETFKNEFGAKKWGGFAEYCKAECFECETESYAWGSGNKLDAATDSAFTIGLYNNIDPEDGASLSKKIIDSDVYDGEITGLMEISVTDGTLLVTMDDESLLPEDNYNIFFSRIAFYAGSLDDLTENYKGENGALLYDDFPWVFQFSDWPSSHDFEIDLEDLPRNEDDSLTIIAKIYYCIEETTTNGQ